VTKKQSEPVEAKVSKDRSKRGKLQGQVKIFVRDDAPPQKITAEKYCASQPQNPDQMAGFLAECRLRYKQTELATVQEWAERHETFKKRPIR
jgi:hypothetical protein